MCGIAGLLRSDSRAPGRELLEAAAERLRRRGPDSSGVWIEGAIGLAHRRLAIIDLSPTGAQPMRSPDGRYAIVYNGEVYNFRELRDELEPRAGHWRGGSDTEVILEAYARWGPACVERFDGMFAFAIWDCERERLFAARDRLGVKPFYYTHGPEGFAFASRPRALLALQPGLSREVDLQGLRSYLEAGYFPAPHSFFRAVRKLPPGHSLMLERGALSLSRYFDLGRLEVERAWVERDEADLLDELEEIVRRAVVSRMVSDVPLGVFLSGGIDSSLVAAQMARASSQPIHSFTIGFEEREYDESRWAARVAAQLGAEHRSASLKVDALLSLLPRFQEEFDEPFFDYSAFPVMSVSSLASEHVKVALSGDGGDELFGGYHYYEILARLGPLYRMPGALRRGIAGAAALLPDHRARLLAGALRQPGPDAAFAFVRSIAKDFPPVLQPDALAATTSLRDLFAETAARFPALAPGERGMRLDALFTLPDDYLQKVDLGSMSYSIEAREPLLAKELVEWAFRLPVEWKLRGGTNKYLLRKLLERHVPRELVERPKQGFGVPVDRWLRGPLREWARERCHDAASYRALPLDRARVVELLELHLSGRRDVHPLLWAVLMLLDFNVRIR
jgi:asparagine synthase (glutamine-hydrolysing)